MEKDVRPTERFTDRAADYVKYRPSYPAAAIDCVLDGLGDPAALVAADIGAGTGIAARLLADRGIRVIAVEPNAAMRSGAAPHPRIEWRDGTAEATGLADGAVHLVTAFQAFHWFRARPALAEFVRVLRKGGRVALVWNIRDASDPFTDAYSHAVAAAATDLAAAPGVAGIDPHSLAHPDARVDPHALDGVDGLRLLAPRVFASAQELDAEGLVGRALSASYMPKSGPRHDAAVAAIRDLATKHADAAGRVRLVYRTFVYRALRR
jgi:SAM-dependent methyltransferase